MSAFHYDNHELSNKLTLNRPVTISSQSYSIFFCYRLFGSSGACSACGQTIPASEFVMRTGGPGAGGGPGPQAPPGAQPPGSQQTHVFHLKCFACSKCGAHLVPGDR